MNKLELNPLQRIGTANCHSSGCLNVPDELIGPKEGRFRIHVDQAASGVPVAAEIKIVVRRSLEIACSAAAPTDPGPNEKRLRETILPTPQRIKRLTAPA